MPGFVGLYVLYLNVLGEIMKKFKVRVPATSANIGVGFDCLGIALEYYLELEISKSDKVVFVQDGKDFDIPLEDNYIYSTINFIAKKYGKETPNYKVEIIRNEIPVSRGLGSSSSAIIAGLLIANRFFGDFLSVEEMAILATEIEGHPDNVLPAIFGGIILAVYDKYSEKKLNYSRIPVDENLAFYVMIPDFKLSTEKARGVLPGDYKISDVISNSSRLAMLIDSFYTKRYDSLRVYLADRLHQPYRFSLIEDSESIFGISEKNGALGEYISGAGPTLISINYDNDDFLKSMKEDISVLSGGWRIEKKKIVSEGAVIIDSLD